MVHVALQFADDLRDIGPDDGPTGRPAPTRDPNHATGKDPHDHTVACLHAAGIDAACISGVWFAPGDTVARPGYRWCMVNAVGAPDHWDIVQARKYGPGAVRPVLNPAGGLRQALSAGGAIWCLAGSPFPGCRVS